MELTIEQRDLKAALAQAGHCTLRRGTLPAAGAVLLDATTTPPTIRATDLTKTLCLNLDACVVTPGRALMPARLLTDLVSNLPSDAVRLLAGDGKSIRVQCHSYTANICTLDPDEFPSPPNLALAACITLPAPALRQAISQVRHAVDADSGSRPTLEGVSFAANGTTLTLAGADGFRLAVKHIEAVTDNQFRVIVPLASAVEMVRLLGDDGYARLEIDGEPDGAKRITLATQDARLTSRLIEGAFPAYEQIIPKRDGALVITCALADLRQALRVITPFAAGDVRIVRLMYDATGLDVSAESADTGSAHAHVQAEVPEPAGVLLFNVQYLAEALAAMDTERVELVWHGAGKPVLVLGVGDTMLRQVVMPVHKGA